MEIADYIPDYPELNDPTFNDTIFHKKEFYNLRTSAEAIPHGKPGDLWPHQQLIARFLSPHTPYNEQLLFHTPGTGKTCGASAIVEINKQDPLVRKPVLIIVPNDTLVNQWKRQIALICTDGQYVPENYFSKDKELALTDAEKTTRLNKLIKPVYHITTMERMRRHIDKYKGENGDKILRDRYSNTIIIIDEAHNLRIQTNTSKKNIDASKGRYLSFHRFLHLVVNSKILLLTGTPMFDRVLELPGLMNLILPLDKQLPEGKKFTKEYLKKTGAIRKITNVKKLFGYLVGRVSYIREGGNFPLRSDIGDTLWTEFIKTVVLEMSDTQLQGYKLAYAKDTQGENVGLWGNSRQAAVFVYENENKYLWGGAASKLLVQSMKPRTIIIKKRKVNYTPLLFNAKYKEDLKQNLELYSAKYHRIVTFLAEHKKEPVFIFTPLVSGAGGAIFLGLILGLFGYTRALGTENGPGLRYALITGDEKSSIQRKTLIDMYNSKENADGSLIQVMIATKTISEGTSFINVRHEIIVSPYWNNSGTEQAIGRGLRADSLLNLPNAERVVSVQQLAINNEDLPTEQNVDARMYQMSESKDFEIRSAERVLKRASWDCPLNYDRNVRLTDTDDSRNCDYQKCNYVCYQTTPEKVAGKWEYNIPEDQLDDSTYLLYYSRPEMLKLVDAIKEIIKNDSTMNISKIHEMKDSKLLVLAIEYIIENHITVYNKWGQACFLRKEGNILFLSDVPTEKDILGAWYTQYPYANKQTPLSQVIDDELLQKDLAALEKFEPGKKGANKIIDAMNLESKIFIYETLVKMSATKMTPAQKSKYNAFVKIFNAHTFEVEGMPVHDLAKIKLDLSYVDFTKGDVGSLQCFKDGKWEVCDKKIDEQLGSVIKELKSTSNEEVINNKYGIYGILTTDGKFKLVDKIKEQRILAAKKGGKTGHLKHTGKVCNYWNKAEIIQIYLRTDADIPIEIDTSVKNTTQLMATIKEADTQSAVPEGASVKVLQKIAALSSLKTAELCSHLQKWFEDHNLTIVNQ